jgi:hypothetical protein
MSDDNHSVASGGSTVSLSNAKMECPHCSKEFQARAIFNHIRTKHPKDLLDTTLTKWIGEAEQGKALKVVWFKKNDFDEEEDITIYACMSSNKTFATEARVNLHFKKNPDHAKEHVKQMKKFMKEVEASKKGPKKCPILLKYHEAVKNNCPILARIMWRAIQFHEAGCKKIIYEVNRLYKPEMIEKYIMRNNYRQFLKDQDTLKKWMDHLQAKLHLVDELRQKQCLDIHTLQPMMEWLETFIIASLPLLDGEVFDWMKCTTQDESIRPRMEYLEEEMYYLASSRWHGVEF